MIFILYVFYMLRIDYVIVSVGMECLGCARKVSKKKNLGLNNYFHLRRDFLNGYVNEVMVSFAMEGKKAL